MPEHQTKKQILLNNFKTTQPGNETWTVYVIFQGKKIYQKILQQIRPEKEFQALLRLQRIKRNPYWKVKFLKKVDYIEQAMAKL